MGLKFRLLEAAEFRRFDPCHARAQQEGARTKWPSSTRTFVSTKTRTSATDATQAYYGYRERCTGRKYFVGRRQGGISRTAERWFLWIIRSYSRPCYNRHEYHLYGG